MVRCISQRPLFGTPVLCLGLLLVGGLAVTPARVSAQSILLPEYAAKAALLFNLAKYTDWPQEAFPDRSAPIVLGILGDDPFGPVLDRLVTGRTIHGRPIVIRRASGIAAMADAHLVFVSASQPDAPQECAALERAGVMTVGDTEFIARYTAVTFAVEGEKVAFSVDLSRALRTGATISSQLLKFAKHVERAGGPDEQ